MGMILIFHVVNQRRFDNILQARGEGLRVWRRRRVRVNALLVWWTVATFVTLSTVNCYQILFIFHNISQLTIARPAASPRPQPCALLGMCIYFNTYAIFVWLYCYTFLYQFCFSKLLRQIVFLFGYWITDIFVELVRVFPSHALRVFIYAKYANKWMVVVLMSENINIFMLNVCVIESQEVIVILVRLRVHYVQRAPGAMWRVWKMQRVRVIVPQVWDDIELSC